MPVPPPDPAPAGPLVLHRRAGIRRMMRAIAVMLFVMGPGLLCLPLLTGRVGDWTGFLVALLAASLLVASGVVVLRAGRIGWLSLTLDEAGLTLRQGARTQHRAWDEINGVQVTRRRNGRATIPTLRIGCATGDLYLDDVYTMAPSDLARLLKRRCEAAGNPWPSGPAGAKPGSGPLRGRRARRRWWLAPGLAMLIVAAAALGARWGARHIRPVPLNAPARTAPAAEAPPGAAPAVQ